ncbi:MAG TPA: beta-galactosidase [Chloroflexia bacterium]|nr:beta-galactosidase [Chloroflexia bacterium]
MNRHTTWALVVLALAALLPSAAPSATSYASPVPTHSFFGMNLYITGQERSREEKSALINAAADLGVRWSREEVSWANLEPDTKGTYNWGAFDSSINQLAARNIRVIGTIQTTPYWASGVSRQTSNWYWHVPSSAQDFIDFSYEAALHYKGKIDVWEIWNEPDVEATFTCNGCNRPALYAQMLAGSYSAIKKANPQATVLIGGLSIHDANNAGMAFLDQVVAASGGKLNFDVLSIHPYMPDRMPESTDPKTVVQNFPYRLDMSYRWLQSHGAPNKETWITENGYSTCSACGTLGVSEEEQARRLVRLHVIAMAAPNVTHFDYFQLKDKFNAGAGDLWGNMAIMRNDLSRKPAYAAYRTLTEQLEGATLMGQGPLMRSVANRWQPQFDRYHYKFSRSGAMVHVIWKIGSAEAVSLPLTQPVAQIITSRGEKSQAMVTGRAATITISEDPVYVIESSAASLSAIDPAIDKASPTGFKPSLRFSPYWQNNGGLPLFGYAISGERMEKSPTDGKEYIVQWFERARFEYHPEYTGTPSEVLLGLLGSQLVRGRSFPGINPPAGVEAVCLKETGHCVWGRFLERWRKLGIPVVGLPLSDQFEETGTDGKTYVVQYFERARFEYHPENKEPFDVLLGLLGRQQYKP